MFSNYFCINWNEFRCAECMKCSEKKREEQTKHKQVERILFFLSWCMAVCMCVRERVSGVPSVFLLLSIVYRVTCDIHKNETNEWNFICGCLCRSTDTVIWCRAMAITSSENLLNRPDQLSQNRFNNIVFMMRRPTKKSCLFNSENTLRALMNLLISQLKSVH